MKAANEHPKEVHNYQVDSAIIRALKRDKLLSYQGLLEQCGQLVQQDQKLFKARLEHLINLDYIKRSDSDL